MGRFGDIVSRRFVTFCVVLRFLVSCILEDLRQFLVWGIGDSVFRPQGTRRRYGE